MSRIHDALRRGRAPARAPHAGRSAHADAVLSALGYKPTRRRSAGLPAILALAVCVAVLAWVLWPSRPAPVTPARTNPVPAKPATQPPAPAPRVPMPAPLSTAMRRALELNVHHAAARDNLARQYEEAGEAARAIDHYRQFLQYAGPEQEADAADVRARMPSLQARIRTVQ